MIQKYNFLFIILGILFVPIHGVFSQEIPKNYNQIKLTFAPLVKQAAPAVVNIYTKKKTYEKSPIFSDPFFRQFFGDSFLRPQKPVQNSLGSGVLVSKEGLVVTNNHVVEDSDEIIVILDDGREFSAKLVNADNQVDLALLQIDLHGKNLPALEFGDSDNINVGDLVMAIGNPFGVGQTVTSGIVSATARTKTGINDFDFFIQTDAAINPGNSGGALIDMDGKLIGINTAIFSRQGGGSIGISFAIPSNMVLTFVNAARKGEKIYKPWIGIAGQKLTAELAEKMNIEKPDGILISSIYPGGPADKAGIKINDIIVAVNNHPISDPASLRFRLALLSSGHKATIKILRAQKELSFDIMLTVAPENPVANEIKISGVNPLTGSIIANLSPALAEKISLEGEWYGVVISQISKGSIAYRVGFEPGDILLKINDTNIDKVDTVQEILKKDYEQWSFAIKRSGEIKTIVLN
ncbi:MAG: Do family serine endopeptidase [Alphaproteobacteria bacterium]|nr:Do family serine endopeptidase [Alphaproteobacteria bacterium]